MILQQLDDGAMRVCLTEAGITKCCVVSSMHLVYDKEMQLRAAIQAEAARAYEQPC